MIAIIKFKKTYEYEIAHTIWIKRDKKKDSNVSKISL